jgi:hypothetical protein
MNIKAVKTQYGEILKIGIHKDLFKDNNVSGDWLNVDVLRAKGDNKPYLVINEYKKSAQTDEEELYPDEIPF